MNWLWSPLYLYESLPTHMGRLGNPKVVAKRFSQLQRFYCMFAHLSAIHSTGKLCECKSASFSLSACVSPLLESR